MVKLNIIIVYNHIFTEKIITISWFKVISFNIIYFL